jgi:hypothetical protein
MLRRDELNTVSAVAVLRHLSEPVVDLFHNPHAVVPIDPAIASSFVRRQVANASERRKPKGPTGFDVRDDPAYHEFFIDPDKAMERVVREILDDPDGTAHD